MEYVVPGGDLHETILATLLFVPFLFIDDAPAVGDQFV